MLKSLYDVLKENEFDVTGRCKHCTGDKWQGHASWCSVGRALKDFEGRYGNNDLPQVSQVRR